jgi:glutamate decarboxylase
MIADVHELDFKVRLNTSSYVNVQFEDEEVDVVNMGMRVNLADQTVYPSSFKLHDSCVNMVANLWNCPKPDDFEEKGVHAGAQTVGSTEACLLAGLCLKFRWRKWYATKHNLSEDEVMAVRPNMVISTQFQAAWEKLFKYMDIEPRLVDTSIKDFAITPEGVKKAVDDKTIGVVCIMGNHYGGHYDPVQVIGKALDEVNAEKGLEVGIHVDGASGGFIAPFQKNLPPWDFRVPNVLSISASGHKFGESVCGTGWVVWRQRKGLSEHVAISVSYLGGKGESYTLNFSRPASGVYIQFYKFMRYGVEGYTALEENMMKTATWIRSEFLKMTHNGKPRFQMLDAGDTGCLPVVTARLNPELKLGYDDIDLQHQIAEEHWYVSGYAMSMTHPTTDKKMRLFVDEDMDRTMFRVVVKSNLTMHLARDLVEAVQKSVAALDEHQPNATPRHVLKKAKHRHHTTC